MKTIVGIEIIPEIALCIRDCYCAMLKGVGAVGIVKMTAVVLVFELRFIGIERLHRIVMVLRREVKPATC